MLLVPERCYAAGAVQEGWAVRLEDGRITAVGPRAALSLRPAGQGDAPEPVLPLPGRLLLPGGVNAHNHSFQSLLRGLGDDLDFMGWRDRVLYPFSRRLDARGIEVGATFAFAEMLRHGITTVVDFFSRRCGPSRVSGGSDRGCHDRGSLARPYRRSARTAPTTA